MGGARRFGGILAIFLLAAGSVAAWTPGICRRPPSSRCSAAARPTASELPVGSVTENVIAETLQKMVVDGQSAADAVKAGQARMTEIAGK